MTFQERFNSAPHRAKYTKYSNDHPAYLAAQEAWEAAHEACAKVCESMRPSEQEFDQRFYTACTLNANAIRARGQA